MKNSTPAIHTPCAWWHQPAAAMEPLEALRITADHLERGEAVPAPAAAIVAQGLRQYLAGKTDITRNLGLRPRKGGKNETPLALEKKQIRNKLIRVIYDLQDGIPTVKAKKTAALLTGPLPTPISPHLTGEINESDVAAYTIRLRMEFGDGLPTHWKCVQRIAKDRGDP